MARLLQMVNERLETTINEANFSPVAECILASP
ncbi:MAG: hypothetical protein ACI9LO_003503, partial [Planctomycetota bacterium]